MKGRPRKSKPSRTARSVANAARNTPSYRHVVLIGFMATGKSTVGRLLARRLNLKFTDLDREIEQQEGRTVPEIFRERGEPAFRRLERAMVRKFAARRGCVIATGGGVILSPANVRTLRAMGPVIELRSDPAVILRRIRVPGNRPLLDKNPRERIRGLLRLRIPLYTKAADAVVNTSQFHPGRILGEIERAIADVVPRRFPVPPPTGAGRFPR
ncbi:MAG: shikimate kinase [Planctomycetota bacterium]